MWDIKMTCLAPFSMHCLMEGMAPSIRWVLVIWPSFMGTLKSTRMRTRLPATETFFSDFLLRDISKISSFFELLVKFGPRLIKNFLKLEIYQCV